jgi:hypothetical protein
MYTLDYIETDENDDDTKYFLLSEFRGTRLPSDIFRPVDYKFGREVCSRIEKSFPF